MRKILIIITLVALTTSFAQKQGVAQESKTEAVNLTERFNDNRNGWQVGEYKYHSSKFENNSYIIAGKSKSKKSIVSNSLIKGYDIYKDWEISLKFKRTEGKSEKPYGFFLGKSHQKAYFFFVNSINQIAINDFSCDHQKYKYKNVSFKNYSPSTDGSIHIRLLKKGTKISVFVNNMDVPQKVMSYDEKYFGSNIGFWVDGNQTVQVQELIVQEKEVVLPKVDMGKYTFEVMPILLEMNWNDATKSNPGNWYNKTGWRLPFNEELKAMYLIRDELGVTGGHVWSLDHGCTHVLYPNNGKYKNAFFMDFRSGEIMCQMKNATRYVLFIRQLKK
jgi:hypothetical protein